MHQLKAGRHAGAFRMRRLAVQRNQHGGTDGLNPHLFQVDHDLSEGQRVCEQHDEDDEQEVAQVDDDSDNDLYVDPGAFIACC